MINLLLTVGVFLFLVLTWFTPDRLKAFGKRRRSFAIGLVVIGLCSIFVPLIVADPAVLGRTHLSPFDILSQLHAGTLGFRDGVGPAWMNPAVVYLTATYLLLSAALLALLVYPSPKLVVGLAASVSLFPELRNWSSPYDELSGSLKSLFYGSGAGLVDLTSYATLLLFVVIGVLATSYLETLDDPD
ncbi:hypothetical protein [Edaphobacter aggregans]|uniref:hypothetical protein n=1 Tax=Edaphobacter aggregans TaxID=570835 RepID=UPI00054CE269|nr:hypothetical protein [Edaphobacter aggregans]